MASPLERAVEKLAVSAVVLPAGRVNVSTTVQPFKIRSSYVLAASTLSTLIDAP
jgi:hypothetical protein